MIFARAEVGRNTKSAAVGEPYSAADQQKTRPVEERAKQVWDAERLPPVWEEGTHDL